MKKLFLSVLFLLGGFIAMAQSQAVEKFNKKYNADGKYLSLSIEGGILKLISEIDTNDENAGDFQKTICGLKSINLYKFNRRESVLDAKNIRILKNDIRKEKFEELMKVRDGDTHIDFLIKENKGIVSDLLLMVDETDEFILLSFSGEIDLAALSRLSDDLHIEGAKYLRKIDQEN
jgi:hypothetical protein